MTDAPIPCPFDGGQGLTDNTPHGTETAYFVRCRSCACEGPWAKSKSGAIRQWNTRQPTPPTTLLTGDTNLTAALIALAQHNIPPDIQELLIHGNPDKNIRPGALQTALNAAKPTQETEEMFGGTFHAFEEWLATRPDLKNAGTAQQLNEYRDWKIHTMTEDEAKTKWCPFSMTLTSGKSANRLTGGGASANEDIRSDTRCLASGCMAWRVRWDTNPNTEQPESGGYCGLATKP